MMFISGPASVVDVAAIYAALRHKCAHGTVSTPNIAVQHCGRETHGAPMTADNGFAGAVPRVHGAGRALDGWTFPSEQTAPALPSAGALFAGRAV